AKKVLTVSCRPDLKSKQLVAFICGELFLFNWQRFTAFQRFRVASSNGGSHFANLVDYSR
ncbi:MAG: hypothetical protein P8N76_17530, partial [Pirellulaceae bacterium]|nr:hypothetical protein [Pirellulaceae bacterium]